MVLNGSNQVNTLNHITPPSPQQFLVLLLEPEEEPEHKSFPMHLIIAVGRKEEGDF